MGQNENLKFNDITFHFHFQIVVIYMYEFNCRLYK